jgi:DNA adenine methylase
LSQTTLDGSKITKAKPFLKWAGGKGQLLKQFEKYYPKELTEGKITKYCEPFIGSGAVFYHIMQTYDIQESLIIDVNQELILAYQTIKKDVNSLINSLSALEKIYLAKGQEERKDFFYETREAFNSNLEKIDYDNFSDTWIERTMQTIFLNRTCFNGLFRVNSKGGFNVPFGDHKNPRICYDGNLHSISKLIQNTTILKGDFTMSKDFIDSNTFVYFDPPYRPLNKTSSFTSYSKFEFTDEEQLKLATFFEKMDHKGAKMLLSNSDPKNENPEDDFFEDAYESYQIYRVKASRAINSKASKRGKINELIIPNYSVE